MIILFGGNSVRSFLPSRPQYAILGTGILGQIASFERRLRWAAQTPLALPYPFRTWPGSGTWAERDKREVRNFFVFSAVYARAILGSWHIYAELELKKHIWENIYFQVGKISKLASDFVPTTVFSFFFLFFFCTLSFSSFWTSRRHRFHPFSSPVLAFNFFYRA